MVKRNNRETIDENGARVKKKRKEILNGTRDRIRNVNRAAENVEDFCIICGKKIKKGQAIRAMPRDQNCREIRVYHLRTCAPGSANWKIFKENGRQAPISPQWRQLAFRWKESKSAALPKARSEIGKKKAARAKTKKPEKELIRQLSLVMKIEDQG
jgi:hypothetical protein